MILADRKNYADIMLSVENGVSLCFNGYSHTAIRIISLFLKLIHLYPERKSLVLLFNT